eukprot:gene7440-9144_t
MNRNNNNNDDEPLISSNQSEELDISDIASVSSSTSTLTLQPPQIPQQPQLQQQIQQKDETATIASVIGFYFFISISLVFLNKILMSDMKFEYPLFITWYQQVVSFVAIYLMSSFVGPHFPSLSFLPAFEFKTSVAYKVLPLTIVLTCMIIFNNLCLEYVEVSFYQVARSLTICFSLVLTYVILHTKTSYRATLACVIVFVGFILGSVGEVNFSWLGVIFGILSSFFVALYSIYVKRVLPVCDGNEWKLSIYNTGISILLILPLILISGEATTLLEQPILYTSKFWVYMTIAGIMGYLISIAIFMQIKHTSPLTNTISGTVKACVQTILAVIIWGNEISFQNALGILLVIGGSFWYSIEARLEAEREDELEKQGKATTGGKKEAGGKLSARQQRKQASSSSSSSTDSISTSKDEGVKVNKKKLLKPRNNTERPQIQLERSIPVEQLSQELESIKVTRQQLSDLMKGQQEKEQQQQQQDQFIIIDLREPKEFFGDYPIKDSQNVPMEYKKVEVAEESESNKKQARGKKQKKEVSKKTFNADSELNFWQKCLKLTPVQWKDKFGFPKVKPTDQIIFYSANHGRSVDVTNMAIKSGFT